MLRKVLTLGMVLILALSLLAVSMITCFIYEAEAGALVNGHQHWKCELNGQVVDDLHNYLPCPWSCFAYTQ